MPPGFACVRQGESHFADDGTSVTVAPDQVDGPGPLTAALQLLLLATPALSWKAVGRMPAAVERRRSIAQVWIVAGIGLVGLGSVAIVVGSAGLSFIYIGFGALLWSVGAVYRMRNRSVMREAPQNRLV